MKRPPLTEEDQKKIEATATFLRSSFPSISPGIAALNARTLVEAPKWSEAIFHAGASDGKALKSFASAIGRAQSASQRISEWTQQGLETALFRLVFREHRFDHIEDFPRPPVRMMEIRATLEALQKAADLAEEMRASWRASHGKNTPAALLVHDARHVWRSLSGREPPPKSLNVDTVFAKYLEGVFRCVGIGMNLQKAYESWADLYYTPGSPLYEPPEE